MNASDSAPLSENTPGLLLALRGWSRGCAALARREFARSLGRKRLSPADLAGFSGACASARRSVSAVTCVAALMLAAKPVAARADLLRGNVKASPGNSTAAQDAARLAAQQKQAAQVLNAKLALARATQSVKALQAAQLAARSAAQLNAGNITNGLGAGGLNVAAGVGTDPSLWLNAQGPVQTVSGDRTQVTIVQTGSKAILTWDEFNVGANTDLYFNQKAGGADASQWIALNRVVGASAAPSTILGSIKAEGQVYVINQNGILFGGASQVNVHSLVASGLDFRGATVADRNATFQQGLAFDDIRANYTLGVDAGSGRPVGDVTVEAGATITSDGSGAVYLFGKNVTNAGTLAAPDGQVVLAAGERLWISKNWLGGHTETFIDPDLRGVRATVQNGGVATNSGIITTERGNITVTGKSVVNAGALTATTSMTANGSVTLVAGDGATDDPLYWKAPSTFGAVTLAEGSLIAITPETGNATAPSVQYRASKIDIFGQSITMASGAAIYAPSATVGLVAKTQSPTATAANDTSFIDIASGAEIQIGGLQEVEVAMERNSVSGELRLDELKDSPLLRDGALRGKTVSVDLRRGTTLADLSGYYDLIQYGVAEMMTAGGALKLDSGSIVTRAGSLIDISGGSVKYKDGYVTTTRLLGTDGKIYDISTASPDITYAGIYDNYKKFESGYLEGKNAGTLIIGPQAGPFTTSETANPYGSGARPYFTSFGGTLTAGITTGLYQRQAHDASASTQAAWTQVASSATLKVGYVDPVSGSAYGPDIIVGGAAPSTAGYTPGTAPGTLSPLSLPASFFDGDTFGHIALISGIGGGSLTIAPGAVMNLGAFGSLVFQGASAVVEGSILAPGGSVSLLANLARGYNATGDVRVNWNAMPEEDRPRIRLGAGAAIDVAGDWVNDYAWGSATGVTAISGGSVALRSVYDLVLESGSVIDAGGGGRLTTGNTLIAGAGGRILLQNDIIPSTAQGFGASLPTKPSGRFDISGADLRGYAIGKGASLLIGSSREIVIGGSGTSTGTEAGDILHIDPAFFRSGGFSSYSLGSARNMTVSAGTVVEPLALSYIVNSRTGSALRALATGGDIASILDKGFLPLELRAPMSLTLANGVRDANEGVLAESITPGSTAGMPGKVTLESGARITMDPGSSIALLSTGDLTVDGTLETRGGSIRLGMTDIDSGSAIRLADEARLVASGYLKTTYVNGVAVRSVENGGSVSIGTINAAGASNFILTDLASVIDVSGIAGTADLIKSAPGLLGNRSPSVATEVGGNAGRVAFTGFSGGYIAGGILATGASATASGGAISVIAGDLRLSGSTSILLTDRTTDRTSGAALFAPVDGAVPVAATQAGTITVHGATLHDGGAADIALYAPKQIAFDGSFQLSALRSVNLGTPLIGIAAGAPADSSVNIRAPYVSFNPFPGTGSSTTPPPDVPAGTPTLAGNLTVSGNLIDIVQTLDLGGNGLGGFGTATFDSTGDIRLTVGAGPDIFVGRLQSKGALVLKSAQTYVTTAGRARAETDPGFLISSATSVTFLGNGGATPVPYSYGETLTVKAPVITQSGVLRAPQGRINLQATDTLTLTAGSLTSVSLEGLIVPIGSASGGFVTPYTGLQTTGDVLNATPSKSISLGGSAVDVKSGATVDLSGGGDLYAYEFIAGNGGSSDILSSAGMFAVLPGYRNSAAPVMPAGALTDGSLKVGDSVRLTGVPGLADGVYTLLPAHYALLSGGMAIKAVATGYANAAIPTTTLTDGSYLVSGYKTVAGSDTRDASTTRFQVMTGEVLRKYSTYNDIAYGDYLKSAATAAGVVAPRTPADAGTLTLAATVSLNLEGRGKFSAPAGALLGNVDIAATKIAMLGDSGVAPGSGYLVLDAEEFTGFGIGSLMLGGTRKQTLTGTQVTVTATDVYIANDAGSALVLPELIVVSKDTVTVAAGSVVRAEGSVSANTSPLIFNNGVSDNGSLLRLSTGDRVTIARTTTTTTGGTLSIADNVTLSATGSIALDGTRAVLTAPGTVLNTAKLDLSSSAVAIGDAPAGTGGLVLSTATLESLGNARSLLVRSYGTIDLHGSLSLGGTGTDGRARLENLIFDSAGLRGVGVSGDTVTINAREVGIRNTAGAVAGSASTGAGLLSIHAETLTLGAGNASLTGFASTEISTGRLVVQGSGALNAAGPLAVKADSVGAAKGSDYAVVSAGTLTLSRGAGTSPASGDMGGRLSVIGASVGIDTLVDMPASIFEARATAGDLTLGEHAAIKATGVATKFYDVTTTTAGGTVRLTSDTGSVRLAAGSLVDVSGASAGGDAGTLAISASNGEVAAAGTLKGTAATTARGGSLTVDTGTFANFSGLNATANAGGFSGERNLRARNQSLTLAAGETIASKSVTLRSDTGDVVVAGSILATGTAAVPDGGKVTLQGGADTRIAATAVIDVTAGAAVAGGFTPAKGSVAITADTGVVDIASGSTIKAGSGSVVVTAQRDGSDVKVTALAGNVTASELIVRGRRDYDYSVTKTVGTSNVTTMLGDGSTWMANAAAIKTRLGNAQVEIQPEIRALSTGDLTIANDINLVTARYATSPGSLVFVSGGALNVNGSVSDGFSTATSAGVLQAGRSWDLAFSSGGDLTLAAGKLIRTGTGDIAISSGRDLILKDTKSVVYTAGRKVADETGFVAGSRVGEYPVDGGDITIAAARDINAPLTQDFVSGWLYRYGYADTSAGNSVSLMKVAAQTSWSVVFANFEQGVGTLGGGDIAIRAGRDVHDLAVALPTTAQQTTAVGASVTSGSLVVRGGGDLDLRAGRDIYGGVTMLGRGAATVAAGGSVASDLQSYQRRTLTVASTAVANYAMKDIHALFALMDATLNVSARGGVQVEAIVDPMMIASVTANVTGNGSRNTFFYSYTDRTSAAFSSAAGDITYYDNPWAGVDLARGNTSRPVNQQMSVPAVIVAGTVSISRDLLYVPGDIAMVAPQGDISLLQFYKSNSNHAFRVAPSKDGRLDLLAAGDLVSETPIIMMDVADEYVRGPASPFRNATATNLNLNAADYPGAATNYGRGFTPLHDGDMIPAHLYAKEGSIAGAGELDTVGTLPGKLMISIPKPVSLRAGLDVADVALTIQHNSDDDVSVVEAGRDILRPNIRVMGEGSIVLEAGRDIDFTSLFSTGIKTVGNVGSLVGTSGGPNFSASNLISNLALKNIGADITLLAGASSMDAAGFAAAYLNPAATSGVVRTYLPELRAYLARLGYAGADDDASIVAAFAALPEESRRPLLLDIYFSELRETGLDVTNPASPRFGSYKRGFDATKTLFGDATPALPGRISLFGKPVTTQAGGDIRILAPTGDISVDVITNAISTNGIITQKGGSVQVMSAGNIALGNSRIFTLQGGDVLLWTSAGDITAGAGSKTRAVPPALTYVVDNDANVLLNAGALQTGSGIGVLDAGKGAVKSRLDLIAPAGTVDAGDAGIRSAGAINIAAQTILGAANISAGGAVTGVAVAPSVNVAAVSAANNTSAAATSGATEEAQKQRTAAARQETPASVFSVEVLGYGGGDDEDRPKNRVSDAGTGRNDNA